MIWNSIASLFGRVSRSVRTSTIAGSVIGSVSVSRARTNPTVFSSVKLIANTVSKLPLEAPGRPLINRVLQAPNPLQNGATFHGDIVTDLLYYGNALIEVHRGAAGTILGLYQLSPEQAPQIEARAGVVTYKTTEGESYTNRRVGGQARYELIHVRDGGGHEPWSQSRISGVQTALRGLIEADSLIANTFRNGIHVGYFFRRDKGKMLGEEEQQKFDESMEKFTARTDENGVQRRGSYAYVGDLEVTPVKGVTPADSDLRGLRSDLKLEVAAGFGVPPFRAGADANTKYSNASAANAALIRDEILALIRNVTATFSEALGTEVTCDTSSLIKGDLFEQLKAAVAARGGPVLDLDEARALADKGAASDKQRAEILKMGTGSPPPRDREGERRDIPEEDQ